ncbi:hypothetical protein GCM10022278_19850 [Allohahella marinimesophila]|uniref:Uncharacterized protein n=1 Tax=Allohahella marinimesophila TaxID=1054972 RepID=A0ABP7P9G3_9GAMM
MSPREGIDTDILQQMFRQSGQLPSASLSLDPVAKRREVGNQSAYTWHVWISSVK